MQQQSIPTSSFTQPTWNVNIPSKTNDNNNTDENTISQLDADNCSRPFKQPQYYETRKLIFENGHVGGIPASLDLLNEIDILMNNNNSTNHNQPTSSQNNLAVVDLGCGDGSTCDLFKTARPEWRIIGIDVNPLSISIARNQVKNKSIEFLEASAYFLPLENESVDVVISQEPDFLNSNYRNVILNHIFRTLHHGGYYLFTLADIPWSNNNNNTVKITTNNNKQWNVNSLIEDLQQVGFQIKEFHDISVLVLLTYKKSAKGNTNHILGNTNVKLTPYQQELSTHVLDIVKMMENDSLIKYGVRVIAFKE
jgi:ubiquinone/menaquinone biosynthesis C-methylase UbiE